MHTVIKHPASFFPVLLIMKSSELAMFQNAMPRLTLLAIIQQDIQMYFTKIFCKRQQWFAQGSWNANTE